MNSDLFADALANGAEIREEPYSFLHMKVFDVDDGKEVSIGSFNQDNWSFLVNNEANVYFRAKREGAQLTQGSLY